MCIKSNSTKLFDLVCSNDSFGVESFLSYCDCKDDLIKRYALNYGTSEILALSANFRGVVLKQKIEEICESIDTGILLDEAKKIDLNQNW